jgi:hypothetical protein
MSDAKKISRRCRLSRGLHRRGLGDKEGPLVILKINSGTRTVDAVYFIKASPMMQPRNRSSNGSCGMEDTASLASTVLRRASAGRER